MRRDQTSSTVARNKKPVQVGTYVMSATQKAIRAVRAKLPVDLIEGSIRDRIGHGRRHELHWREAFDPSSLHQPCDALFPDVGIVVVSELGLNARSPVGFA